MFTLEQELKMPRPEVLLFVDTETSGLDPEKDRLLEVACLRYHVPTASVIDARSWLFHAEDNPAESINGIPSSLLQRFGRKHPTERSMAASEFSNMMLDSDVVLAWNVAFDRRWIRHFLKSVNSASSDKKRPWVCAMDDMTWPKPSPSRALSATALAHEVGLVDAHRALPDIWTMARLFRRASELGTDIADQVMQGLRPKATYEALVGYADRHLAKSAGFRWDEPAKKWVRTMARLDAQKLPFAVKEWIAEGSTWLEAHQGLRVFVATSPDYKDVAFMGRVLASLGPRTVLGDEKLPASTKLFLDKKSLEQMCRFRIVDHYRSFPPELVIVFGNGDEADEHASLARESQIEVVRPVKESES